MQFSKYNVRRDSIFEMETLMGTHQVKEMISETSHDTSMLQQASQLKASVSTGFLEGAILSLRLRHLWVCIRLNKWDVFLSGDSQDPSKSQWRVTTRLVSLDREILSLIRRHLWARIRSIKRDVALLGDSHDPSRSQTISILKANTSNECLVSERGSTSFRGSVKHWPRLALLPLRHRKG